MHSTDPISGQGTRGSDVEWLTKLSGRAVIAFPSTYTPHPTAQRNSQEDVICRVVGSLLTSKGASPPRGWNDGGGTDTEIRVSTEKFSRRSSRDSNPRPFNHESGALTTELSTPPELRDDELMLNVLRCHETY